MQEGPYLALFLKEVNDPDLDKRKFLSLLLLACSLSKHTRLIFPVSGSVSRFIDEVFDELFKSRRQMFKDFVVGSKGIVYAKDLTAGETIQLLECAASVITTDERISKAARINKLSYAYISPRENRWPEITVSDYERVEDRHFEHSLIAVLEA
ncbi:MAG TPA: hypothetical protein VJ302_02245 [Blastocatellia bacterium]|nr:hypothetical protein [Blastocatellia bacterium]